MNSSQERSVAESIWLVYFNDYLLAHEVISEYEHMCMFRKITERDR